MTQERIKAAVEKSLQSPPTLVASGDVSTVPSYDKLCEMFALDKTPAAPALSLRFRLHRECAATGLAAPPCGAACAVFQNNALGRQRAADAVGFGIILGFARGEARGDLGFDIGIRRAGLVGGLPTEPRFGVLLQQAQSRARRQQLRFDRAGIIGAIEFGWPADQFPRLPGAC